MSNFRKPSGNTKHVGHHRHLHDLAASLKILESPDIRATHTARGTLLEIKAKAKGTTSSDQNPVWL